MLLPTIAALVVAALLLLAETALLHLEVLVALEQHRQFPVAA
jgi:hypothetical protein